MSANTESLPALDPVEESFTLPASLWEQVKDISRRDLVTTDEIVAEAIQSYVDLGKAERSIEDGTGLRAHDLAGPLLQSAVHALVKYVEATGEVTVPIRLAVIPPGKLPVFLPERTVRYVCECCALADVDPHDWVEGWIGEASVNSGLGGKALDGWSDVTLGGITEDLVNEYVVRTDEEKAELFEDFREVAARYQAEVLAEREAEASNEGGEA